MRVSDTLKRATEDHYVRETIEREGVWQIQTPQAFPRDVLERAHLEASRANHEATDDASLCERIGATVVIVPGSHRAMKITSEDDFAAAEALSILRE
jgi:2-C-methyl-D-erythritol 4-phosphate cytidylyltransferase